MTYQISLRYVAKWRRPDISKSGGKKRIRIIIIIRITIGLFTEKWKDLIIKEPLVLSRYKKKPDRNYMCFITILVPDNFHRFNPYIFHRKKEKKKGKRFIWIQRSNNIKKTQNMTIIPRWEAVSLLSQISNAGTVFYEFKASKFIWDIEEK